MKKLQTTLKTFLSGAVLGALVSTSSAGCIPDDCEPRDCAELLDGWDNNGRTCDHCILCNADGDCIWDLKDEDGEAFFHCDSRDGGDCLEAVVDAQWAYCEA